MQSSVLEILESAQPRQLSVNPMLKYKSVIYFFKSTNHYCTSHLVLMKWAVFKKGLDLLKTWLVCSNIKIWAVEQLSICMQQFFFIFLFIAMTSSV